MTDKNKIEEEERLFFMQPSKKKEYDLDILLAYNQIKDIVNKNGIKNKEKIEQFLKFIEDDIRSYCDFNKINFDLHLKYNRPIIIKPSAHNYDFKLALFLIGFDLYQIKSFLNYQLTEYKTIFKGEKKAIFPSLVESLTSKHIKRISPFDNKLRLKEINDWVNENRIFSAGKNGETIKKYSTPPKIKTDKVHPKLEWSSKYDQIILRKLSNELKLNQYTKLSTDFHNVFTKQKKTYWYQKPETLAYLLHRLYFKYKAIETTKKGFFKNAQLYFNDFTGSEPKKFGEGSLKNLNYNVIKRFPEKHSGIRIKIDYILKSVFQTSK